MNFFFKLVLLNFFLTIYAQISANTIVYDMDSLFRMEELTEISVLANKEQQALKQLPVSGTTLSSYHLKQYNIFTIKDITSLVPNLFSPDYGTKLTSPIYIRGIGSRINSPSVGLYVDGIPYFEKTAFDFDLMEIVQIDVLRGPQGTLYGRNTMGGIIQVNTLSPLKYQGTRFNLTVGNYNTLIATMSHYGKIKQYWGYAISANLNSGGGYFLNTTTLTNADALMSGSARIKLQYHKNKWEVAMVSSVEVSNQTGYPYMAMDTVSQQPTEVKYNDPSFFKRTLNSNGLFVNYKNSIISITSRTAHQYYKSHQGIDQDFSPQSLYYINQYENQQMISQEFQIRNATLGRFAWTAGLFGFYQHIDKRVEMEYYRQAFITDKYYLLPSFGASVFAQGTMNNLLIKGLSLTLGLRYDLEYAQTIYQNFKETAAGKEELINTNFNHQLSFQQVSPKVSLQYGITEYNNLYATLTKGYKSGGFNTSFATDEEKTFEPEYSWNYEIGTKLLLAEGRVNTEFALFYIDWKNQQVYQPLSTGTGSLLRNAAQSVSKGIEIALGWHIIQALRLQASYGYTHATFKEYVNGEQNLSGNFLPYVPQNTVSGMANYTITPNAKSVFNRIILSVNYSGVGELYWNSTNTVKQSFYHLLGARASFHIQEFTAALWAKNISNSNYNAFYFEALGNSYIQKARPTTFGVDLSYTF